MKNYFLKKAKFLLVLLSILPVIVLFQNCGQNSFKVKKFSNDLNLLSESPSEIPRENPPEEIRPPITGSGKIYYVSKSGNNTNGLSEATAFQTIQKASAIAEAGDTVVVLAGIYKEEIHTTNDGNAKERIRFVSMPRWAAKIAPIKGSSAFWTNDGAYVDIEGFTFDGKLGGEIPLFRVRAIQSNGNASRIMYNNIRLYRACTSALFYRTGVGIGVGAYESNYNTEIFGNIIRNTRVVGCSLPPRIDEDSNGTYHFDEAGGYGMYLSTPKTKAYNNIIYGFRIGIHLWHNPTENIVSHNLIFDNGNFREGYRGIGIVFGCGDKPFTTCRDIIIANNIIMSNKTTFATREMGKNVEGTNRVINNIVYNNKRTADDDDNTGNAIVTGPGDNIVPMVEGVSGNSYADPKLVNFQPNGTGNYRLLAGSPAISKASTIGAVIRDINQSLRPTAKDIGPYQYGVTGAFPVDVSTANLYLAN